MFDRWRWRHSGRFRPLDACDRDKYKYKYKYKIKTYNAPYVTRVIRRRGRWSEDMSECKQNIVYVYRLRYHYACAREKKQCHRDVTYSLKLLPSRRYVFIGVRLFVSRITQNQLSRFSQYSVKMAHGPHKKTLDFGIIRIALR